MEHVNKRTVTTRSGPRHGLRLAALVVALLLGACGEQLTDEEYVIRAEKALAQGDLNATAIELKNALKLNPVNARARFLLGRTYYALGDGKSAEKELRRAREMGLSEREVFIPLARAVLMGGAHESLLEEFQDSPQLTPGERTKLLAVRGMAHLYMGDIQEAEASFVSALSIDQTQVDALLGRALVAKARGDIAQARQWLDKAMAQDDKRPEAWSLLGELQELAGRRDEAIAAFGKAVQYAPIPDRYRLQRALLHIDMRNYQDAQEDIRKLPASQPGKHYARGLIELQQKDYLAAQASFEEALSKYQDYTPAQYYLGLTHVILGNEEQALSYLRQFVAQVPESVQAANLLAKLQIRKGDLAAAEALLDPIFQENPEQPDTLDMMAGLELIQGNNEVALARYRKLLAQNPESADARSKLGMALILGGQPEQGVAEMEKAIELAPDDEQIERKMVLAQIESGELEGAISAAERWAQRKPQSVHARLALGWAHLHANQPQLAQDAFAEVLELQPGEPSASHNLAVFALYAGDVQASREYYEQSQMFYQGHPGTSIGLARLYMQSGEPDKAIAVLETSREKYPAAIEPRVMLARVRLESGQTDRALEEITALYEHFPEHPGVLSVLGATRAARGNYQQAVKAFEQLQDRSALSPRDYYNLAQVYHSAGDRRGFSNALREAYAKYPGDYAIQMAMAGLLMGEGDLDAAQTLVEQLQQGNPARLDVHLEAAKLARLQGEPAREVEAMGRALELAPEESPVLVRYALALTRDQRQDEAIRVLQNWMAQHPDDGIVRYNLANLYLLAGERDRARATFEEVVERDRDHALALNNLAWLLGDTDLDRALQYAERANQVRPETPSIQDTLATLLLKKPGQADRAVALLRSATEKNPTRTDFQYHLATALAQQGADRQAHRVLSALLRANPEFEERAQAQALLDRLAP